MAFLLSEDEALRNLMLGVTVTDQKSATDSLDRPVSVFFGQPDQELRSQSYPYITVDMIDVSRDFDREHRGKVNDVTPNADYLTPANLPDGMGWEFHYPIPVNIDYQITTYCRHPRQDRQLLSQILHTKLPFRFGQISLDDGTIRRVEVLDVSKRDNNSEQAKRLFVNAFTVRVSSEIPEVKLSELYKVLTVHTDVLTDITQVTN